MSGLPFPRLMPFPLDRSSQSTRALNHVAAVPVYCHHRVCDSVEHTHVPDLKSSADPTAERGHRFRTETAMIPANFHESTIDDVRKSWPQPLPSKAAISSLAERTAVTLDRYGLPDGNSRHNISRTCRASFDVASHLEKYVTRLATLADRGVSRQQR